MTTTRPTSHHGDGRLPAEHSMSLPSAPEEEGSGLGELLTPTAVSEYLGIPESTLANWRYLRRGPAYLRVGRHVRYRAADVAAWVHQQLTATEPG